MSIFQGFFDSNRTFPFGSGPPGAPVSLVNSQLRGSANADARRAIADATADNGEPDTAGPGGTKVRGFHTFNRSFLHITVKIAGDPADSVDWKLWTRRSGVDDEWTFDTRGQDTLLVSDDDNPQTNILEIANLDFVYIELKNFVGAPTAVDVWLASGDSETSG